MVGPRQCTTWLEVDANLLFHSIKREQSWVLSGQRSSALFRVEDVDNFRVWVNGPDRFVIGFAPAKDVTRDCVKPFFSK